MSYLGHIMSYLGHIFIFLNFSKTKNFRKFYYVTSDREEQNRLPRQKGNQFICAITR